ncbi:MAG: hypothetical protein AB8F95_17365 [Bacteroidia bacterium]
MRYLIIISCALVALLVSCVGVERLSPEDYMSWLEEKGNPLISEKAVGDYDFAVQQLPPEAVALRAYGDAAKTEKDWEGIVDEYAVEKRMYVLFRIANNASSQPILKQVSADLGNYQANTQYMAFGMQKDIKILQAGDTVNCGFFHFERTFDLTPFSTYMLSFDLPQSQEDAPVTFLYNDQLLGVGPVKMGVSSLYNVPKLDITRSTTH